MAYSNNTETDPSSNWLPQTNHTFDELESIIQNIDDFHATNHRDALSLNS